MPPVSVRVYLSAAMVSVLAACTGWAQEAQMNASGPSRVRVEQTPAGWRLMRNGQAYFIKGAAGHLLLDRLVELGGNSIRTWGVGPDTAELLDRAHRLGLTVTVGIWLMHEGDGGFNYENPEHLAQQTERVRQAVLAYKDHPAVLIWSLGNETEHPSNRPAIYRHINELARLVKSLDPHHPTMTIIADLGADGSKVRHIHRFCPEVDIVGINSYGGIRTLAQRYLEAGGKKPYIVTEHGPPGQWESPTTAWGAPIELSSTEKTLWYRQGYERAVLAHPELCLGAYAFLWGYKQEATATWYGLFLPDGSALGAVDVLTELWTGRPPANRAPVLEKLSVNRQIVEPGQDVEATVAVSDPDGDELFYRWELQADVRPRTRPGEFEPPQEAFPQAIVRTTGAWATVRMPEKPGPYRLYVFVRDGRGSAATANVPLLVQATRP